MCWPRCATPGFVGAGAELVCVLISETSPMTAPARAPAQVATTRTRPMGRRRGAGRAGMEDVLMDAQGLAGIGVRARPYGGALNGRSTIRRQRRGGSGEAR